MAAAEMSRFKSPLHEMTQTTPTCLWNDSASIHELTYSLEHGAVGATCNPVIALGILQKEMPAWKDRINALVEEMRGATEDGIGRRVVEEMSIQAATLLERAYAEHQGRNGRLSIQTDPRVYRDAQAIVDQAVDFHGLAPNMIVKIPATSAGIPAIEEATYRGVSVNATVSFTLPQVVSVAEAVERGLRRREAEGLDISAMGPVCTIMVGRLDDWLKVVAKRDNVDVDPICLEWAGVAVFKKAYRIFRERAYRVRLLAAAFRNDLHWSELIGGDVVISPPYAWQVRFNGSGIPVADRIHNPVDPAITAELQKFHDFRCAYDEAGMRREEFDCYGATVMTLRQFCAASSDLSALIRDFMLPRPAGA